MKKFFTLFLGLVASAGTIFASIYMDGVWYNLVDSNKTAYVTYKGSYAGQYEEYSGVVTIPSTITYYNETYAVTSIGEAAFYKCTSLTSVTIPNSVTSIGYDAFSGCSSLTSINIPNSITSIGSHPFDGCSSLGSPLFNDHIFVCLPTSYSGEYTIPTGIQRIASYAFYKCKKITSVAIPNSVTTLGIYVFAGCDSLPTITIPEHLTSIGRLAFASWSGLVSIEIPDHVTEIGYEAFLSCKKMTDITIGNGVKTIREYAFRNCTKLKNVTIGNGLKRIEYEAFANCSKLISINIPDSVTYIGQEAFYECSSLPSLKLGDGVAALYAYTFMGCWKLTSLTMGRGISNINENAFLNTGLTDIYVPCGELERIVQVIPLGYYKSICKYASPQYSIDIASNIPDAGQIIVPENECDSMITVIPNEGYSFVQWSDGNTDNPRIISLTQDTTFTAWFAINQYAISVSCDPQQGSIEGESGSFDYGVELTYKAIANEGYHFVQWSDGNTDNPRIISLTQDSVLSAEFAINTYLVQFFGFNNALLSNQTVEHGTAAVAPNVPYVEHYDFVGWDKEFTNVTSDLDIFAIYQENSEDIEELDASILPQKTIIEGHIFILRGEKVYTIQGQEIK